MVRRLDLNISAVNAVRQVGLKKKTNPLVWLKCTAKPSHGCELSSPLAQVKVEQPDWFDLKKFIPGHAVCPHTKVLPQVSLPVYGPQTNQPFHLDSDVGVRLEPEWIHFAFVSFWTRPGRWRCNGAGQIFLAHHSTSLLVPTEHCLNAEYYCRSCLPPGDHRWLRPAERYKLYLYTYWSKPKSKRGT